MNRSKVFLGAGRYLLVGFASVIALVPVVWMATMAFKPREEWTSGIDQLSWLPKNPTLDNFTFIFTGHAPKLLVAIDRVAVGPAISSLVCASLGTIIAVVGGNARRVRGFSLQGRPEFAALHSSASLVSASRGHDPGNDHVGLPRPHRHMVGAVVDIRHCHAAILVLADDDLFRRRSARDRGGRARRRMHALDRVPPRNPADGKGATGDDRSCSFSSSTGRTTRLPCCSRVRTGSRSRCS